MVRHIPKVVFLGVMVFAALMSADLGPRFVRTENVVVWYEQGVTPAQADAVLQHIARDLAAETAAEPSRRYEYRLTRGPGGVCLQFNGVDFAKLTPATAQFIYEYAQQIGAAAFPGEPLLVEVSDGAGRVESIAAPAVGQTDESAETAAVNG